jgi:hypothetical protein
MNQDMMHLNDGDSSPMVGFSQGVSEPTGSHVNRMRQMHEAREQEDEDQGYDDEEEFDEEEILGDDHDYDIEDDEGLFYDPAEENGLSGSAGSDEQLQSNMFIQQSHDESTQHTGTVKSFPTKKKKVAYDNFF